MANENMNRRRFIKAASIGSMAAVSLNGLPACAVMAPKAGKLAMLGGDPVRTKGWPGWPIWDPSAESDCLSVLRSGKWYRGWGNKVATFEKAYAKLLGANRCLATASGTSALITALQAVDVDAGDEVIVSPYTFIATYNVVFMNKALPVFADTDPETFQINPDKIEARITDRTRAILPVHILGLPADMDRILAIGKKHNLSVVEDACQAWLAQWRGKSCGTLGDLGCFSFQNSKHLASGEGGAVVGNDGALLDRCNSIHNCGRPFGAIKSTSSYPIRGYNRRMPELMATVLLSQMKRLEADTNRRFANAQYLTSRLRDIPGILPARLYDGVTRAAYHLYPFRYKKEHFNNAPLSKFLGALRREGIPCGGGYGPQYRDGLIEEALQSRGYQRLFSKARLKQYREELHFPGNDQLCREAVWLSQTFLLTEKADMDNIADAITKIYENRDKLV